MKILFRNKNLISQFLKFGIVGLINSIIAYGINTIGYYKYGLGTQILNLLAFIITVFISYMLNSRFVFKSKTSNVKENLKMLGKAYASYSFTGLFLTAILFYIEENIFGVPHYMSAFINIVIGIPINFLLNKFWTYAKHSAESVINSDLS